MLIETIKNKQIEIMINFTPKQIKAIKKAEKLIKEANDLLQNNVSHLSYEIIVAQYLTRVQSAAKTSSIIED